MNTAYADKNVNVAIGNTTAIATEIKIRSEISETAGNSVASTWKMVRPNVQSFLVQSGDVAGKFAFVMYSNDVISLMGRLLDDATRDKPAKG